MKLLALFFFFFVISLNHQETFSLRFLLFLFVYSSFIICFICYEKAILDDAVYPYIESTIGILFIYLFFGFGGGEAIFCGVLD